MTLDDLREIETRLTVALPAAYCSVLLGSVPLPSALVFAHGIDPREFFIQDAKRLLIENLELRMGFWSHFSGGPWRSNHLCLGNNGAGDHYFIDTFDASCAVQVFNHEAGEFEPLAASLPAFFTYLVDFFRACEASAKESQSRFSELQPWSPSPSKDVFVARTENPYESALDPITMSEWRSFVDSNTDLEMRGVLIRTNPFTGGEMRMTDPGLTVFKNDSPPDMFYYRCGRIRVEHPSPAASEKLQRAAEVLHAKISRDD